MRISRVYTRTGDKGTTRLVGGQVVAKDSARIDSYGTIDELGSVLGLARAFNQQANSDVEVQSAIDGMIHQVQNDLFDVGSDLATLPADRWDSMYQVGPVDIGRLEGWCDELNEELGPLEEFILPGGGPVGAALHQARTVCRRAERLVVGLARDEEQGIAPDVIRYLNRLSDFLFVLARWAGRKHGEPELLWERR
jgi:cob(I)alamin adenosyltransferase